MLVGEIRIASVFRNFGLCILGSVLCMSSWAAETGAVAADPVVTGDSSTAGIADSELAGENNGVQIEEGGQLPEGSGAGTDPAAKEVDEDGVPALQDAPSQQGDRLRPDQMRPLEKARYYAKEESFELAERAYVELIEQTGTQEELEQALLELSEVYYESGQYVKGIEVLNMAFQRFGHLGLDAEKIYRLGEFYQAAGLYEKAVDIFYEVINTVVISGSEELDEYLPVARMAQFQIARTNYENGDFRKAYEAFDRIDVLDLSRENREVVLYYEIVSALKAGETERGGELIDEFFTEFPESEYSRELSYLRAEVLMMQGRPDEATDHLVKILDSFDSEDIGGSEERVFWKQQAGNRLANRFYAEGDYAVALRIYQGMLGLGDSPNWRLPIVYQMGLCFEKLGFFDRARESYTYLLEDLEQLSEKDWNRSLRHLEESVKWRSEVLQWRESAEATSAGLLNQGRG